MALEPGTRLGPYEISPQVGMGGMGEVYRATDRKLPRDVAIKVLPDAFAQICGLEKGPAEAGHYDSDSDVESGFSQTVTEAKQSASHAAFHGTIRSRRVQP